MKVLGINGSPKSKGNSAFLLNECLESAKKEGAETEIIHLADYRIKKCNGCDRCIKEKKCNLDDDYKIIEEKMIEADALVLASPVYVGSVSGLMKDFGDRARPLRMDSFRLKDKFAAFISVAGLRHGGQEHAFIWFIDFSLYSGLILIGNAADPVSQGYFPAASLQRDDGNFSFVKRDSLAIEESVQLGKRIVEILKKFRCK
ncbi:MAG: flavodoxin family protein [Candidatus Diapherotrites archaeon]